MNKRLVVGGIILVVLLGLTGFKLWLREEPGLTATGTIEITQVDIAPKINGYLSELKVEAGDTVNGGAIIAKVVRADLEAQLLRDEAALARAEAQLDDLKKGSREAELQAAAASVKSAKAVLEKNRADFERLNALYRKEAISKQELDNIRAALEVAENAFAAAQSQYNLLMQGSRPGTITAQAKEVERNRAIVAMSRITLDDTHLSCPIHGVVLSKNYQNGEYVNVGAAVLTVGDLNDCWVKIYLSSTQLGLIKLGQTAKIRIDSFSDRDFRGTIKEISQKAEYTPRQSITQKERANMVFAVKVKLDNRAGILKPGMPADVVIQ
ncbi:MAG TPA: efflux RND transporter periplasmic adaptor subunit [Bacillota bacterium]|nr:efflux RND transporter periplasmic adaptor subunit [Bacillota bacterium]